MARLIIATVLPELVESSESDASSDSDNEELLLMIMGYRGHSRRIPRIQNYVENVVPEYTNNEFKAHYRMYRETFQEVLALLGPAIIRQNTDENNSTAGRNTIPVEKQILLAIWVFTTPDSYRSVCEKFNVGRATAIRTVRRVTKALCNLAPEVIKWPSAEIAEVSCREFERQQGFPKILGAIDGSHIPIQAPNQNPEAYINRKGYHSIQLQAVCDHRMLFLHCYAGQVGSVHDQRVLRLSDVQEYLNDDTKFPDDCHLIGDAAYAISRHMMVPFKNDRHLTARQQNFNFRLSSSRMVIERSFGLLKGRFRSLLDRLAMARTDLIPDYILACCVLHNICILKNDLIDELPHIEIDNDQQEGGPEAGGRQEGIQKRLAITQLLPI